MRRLTRRSTSRSAPGEDRLRESCGLFGIYRGAGAARHTYFGLYAPQHRGRLAAAHNGNLVNAAALRSAMEEDGSIFQTTTDSEIVRPLIARSKQPTLVDMVAESLEHTVGEIRDFIVADSLKYLSVDGMLAVAANPADLCTACFTGDYPTEVPTDFRKEQFDLSRRAMR